ncbi:MAG: PhzF family phenazine biosynthesis protein [Clostridiales Family XIII bacterium]|nr:PhzF family phenazine biosynthesis protein [Clostridiales Family XIII bacterium]
MKFYIADAFTKELFGGNPAGVVYLEFEDFPSDERMRKTAAELRYSETAFVRRLGVDSFETRYFTPVNEVDLCGHATIGAFRALLHAGIVRNGERYRNVTKAGDLYAEISSDAVMMEMGTPVAVGTYGGATENSEGESVGENFSGKIKHLYNIMGLNAKEQFMTTASGEETAVVPKIVSTGLPDILLPVFDEAELSSIRPDFEALAELSEAAGVTGVHAFTTRASDGRIHVRNFAPLCGIDEEAATGTANGALAYFLYSCGVLGANASVRFIQGESMGRPSEIECRVERKKGRESSPSGADGSDVTVKVGGDAVVLVEGNIRL